MAIGICLNGIIVNSYEISIVFDVFNIYKRIDFGVKI